VPLGLLATPLGATNTMLSVLIEGGGEVHASFLEAELADEVVLYVAPKVVGGPAKSWVGGKGIGALASAHAFRFEGPPELVGADLVLRAVRVDSRPPPVRTRR
jgi:diaminohydroxyphosphoribosylaminopyrimidine deaminase / 5-amino-6-(5-phosphoribosylamino)uracil reductase